MKIKHTLRFVAVVVIILVCYSAIVYVPQYYQAQAYASSDSKAYSVDKSLVLANTRFGLDLLKELQGEDQGENIFISPLSISIALAMIYNGAEGSTKAAMAEALNFNGMSLEEVNIGFFNLIESLEHADQAVSLSIGNSIWMEKGFEPRVDQGFRRRISDSFKGDVYARPFSDPKTLEEINNWISGKTNGRIDRMIDSIDPQTVMFLINAIYFKGEWVSKFDGEMTSKSVFHLTNGSESMVDMMHVKGVFNYYSGEDFQAVRLPYGRNKIAMYVFLPPEDTPLESFIEDMNQERLEDCVKRLEPGEIIVRLPRFKLEYEEGGAKRLNNVLTNMGMGIAFTPEADFNGMTSTDPSGIWIGYVDHKAVIEVNEKGTEAAAVTVGAMITSMPNLYVFTANRPFFFVIRDDRSGSIIFMGKIMNPPKAN